MKTSIRSIGILLLGVAALGLSAALATPIPIRAKSEWRKVLSGQGTGLIVQHLDSTTGTKCYEARDDSSTSVWSVTREGNMLAAGYVSSQQVLAASTVQSLGAAATLTVPTGKSLVQVVGTAAPRTLSTTTPIAAGTVAGLVVVLEGTDDTNTVTVPTNGTTNIKGANGTTSRVLGAFDLLTLVWDGTAWVERSYSNNT